MRNFLLLIIYFVSCSVFSQTMRKRTTLLMGSRFDITIIDKDSISAENDIDEIVTEITRIENLISDWREHTQISQVNQNAGIKPVKVDLEVIELTERALNLSKLTNGAFDISFAAMDKVWKFDGTMLEMPSKKDIRQSVKNVGYKNVIVDRKDRTLFLKNKGMKIGFGALGEGYAADRCRKLMIAKGVFGGIVNASGDMSTWGTQIDGSPWNIGITDPKNRDELIAVIPLQETAVVTSGNYQKFVIFNGKRYSHIINPATGYPATGLSSVTVIGPSAEIANGISTSIIVLGKRKGLQLLEKFPDYKCLLIDDDGIIDSSTGFNIEHYQLK